MQTRTIQGYLFDVDECGSEIVLWVYADNGRLLRLTKEFQTPVYLSGERESALWLGWQLERRGLVARCRPTRKTEFWSGRQIDVVELYVSGSLSLQRIKQLAPSLAQEVTFYNLDIPPAQYFLYLNRLTPLAPFTCTVDETYRVLTCESGDGELTPRLRVMKMWGERLEIPSAKRRICLACDDESMALNLADAGRAVRDFNFFVDRHDPDVLLSKKGDGVLFPALLLAARKAKVFLLPDREDGLTWRRAIRKGKTFYSYGQVLYRAPAYPLRGRWHIDEKNSFFYSQTGIEGILELSRYTRLLPQRLARGSPGTAMLSAEFDYAIANDILVPWRKSEPERFKSALKLYQVDKGGLSFVPAVGIHENVAEIDFASMYPTIMVHENVSPETVLCACCENNAVPEAGYNICQKRRGLIPQTLAPFLDRREKLTTLLREEREESIRTRLEARQTALKWMMVTCFGYLGYRNARFGRIEAHEAVTAFGREKLLRAKELAEARGFRLLHALTDSLWLQKAGATTAELLDLCAAISNETNVTMRFQGFYRWLVFPPSKVRRQRPVLTRYYGLFADGKMKVRGLACRRRDTPAFIKEAQLQALALLSRARTRDELMAKREDLQQLLAHWQARISALGKEALTIRRRLTRPPRDYRAKTASARAARLLADSGLTLHAGESVEFVWTTDEERLSPILLEADAKTDRARYAELLRRAFVELNLG